MNPFEPGVDLDRRDPSLDEVASRLESYTAATGGEPPVDLASRISAAIDDEPEPAGRWAWLGTWTAPMRAVAAVAILVAIVVGTLAVGTLIDSARRNVGTSPPPALPSVSESPSPVPSPTPTASPSPSPSVAPSSTGSATPRPTVTPVPSPGDDDDDDEIETPEPSESDHDNSGPGGGGGSGSGSGSGSGDD